MMEHGEEGSEFWKFELEKMRQKLLLVHIFDTETSEFAKKLHSLERTLRAHMKSTCDSKGHVSVSSILHHSVEDLQSIIRRRLCSEESQNGTLTQATPDLRSHIHACYEEALQFLKAEASLAVQKALEGEALRSNCDVQFRRATRTSNLWQEMYLQLALRAMEAKVTTGETGSNESLQLLLESLPSEPAEPADPSETSEISEPAEPSESAGSTVNALRSAIAAALHSDIESRRKRLWASHSLLEKLNKNVAFMWYCIKVLLLKNDELISCIAERQKGMEVHRVQLCPLREAASQSSDVLIHVLPQARSALLSTESLPSCWRSTKQLLRAGDSHKQSRADAYAKIMECTSALQYSQHIRDLSCTIETMRQDLDNEYDAALADQKDKEGIYGTTEMEELKQALSTWETEPAQWCRRKQRVGGHTFKEWVQLLSSVQQEKPTQMDRYPCSHSSASSKDRMF